MTTTAAPTSGIGELRPPEGRAVTTRSDEGRRAIALPAALVLAVAGLTAAALGLTRADYVPMWDGRIYADCVIDAVARPFRLDSYRCASHVSHAYVAILALAQRAAPYSPAPMLVANLALFGVAAVALWRILGRLFPDANHDTARALTTAAFLVHPIVLATLVQPGLDFGVLVFALCAVAAAVEGRATALAVAGSLLVFTKEPGLLVYAVVAAFVVGRSALPASARWPAARAVLAAVAAFVGVYNLAPSHPAILPGALVVALGALLLARPRGGELAASHVARAVVRAWPLAVPLLLFAAYAAYRIVWHGPAAAPGSGAAVAQHGAAAGVMWGGDSARMLAHTFLRIDLHPFARSALALVFVVGFLWIPTAIIAADAVVGAARTAARQPRRVIRGGHPELVAFFLAMTAVLVWALTRYVTYSNARYYLPLYPLVLVATLCALVRLGVRRRAREVVLAAIVVLLAVSSVRTVDPLSRRLWGTFRAGDREMLRVTSLTGECCGHGRDQLAYNLEFTALAELQDTLFARIRMTDRTLFVMHAGANWHTVGPLDARHGRRTLHRADVIQPQLAPASFALRPDLRLADGWSVWFLAFPNVDNDGTLAALRERFDVGPADWAKTPSGHAMAAYPLRERLRPASSTSPP